jgi:hypothetical protein
MCGSAVASKISTLKTGVNRVPSRPLRICLRCVEIFARGKYGGFGWATRTIARELVAAGHDVTAIVPRRDD